LGKSKKIGIGIGIVILGFILLSVIDSPETITAENKNQVKYDGLTAGQISKVRLVEDSCKNNAQMAYSQGGASVEELYSKRCNDVIEDKIEGYLYQNTVKQISISKDYSLCHTLRNNINCLAEVATITNDSEACNEMLNSPVGGDQIYDENMTHLEYRQDICLKNLL